MKTATVLLVAAAFALGGLVGAYALLPEWPMSVKTASGAPHPVWQEMRWPFPMDQWGQGKAFQCKAADCGTEVSLYIRAKIGFCNCTTGVSDDEELDRISDFDLFGNKLAAQAPGHPITVAWMKGRSRLFSVRSQPQAGKSALSVGFNDHCDAIIATAVIADEHPATVEPAVLDFLNSKIIIQWAQITLGL